MDEDKLNHLETDLLHAGMFKDRQYNSVSTPIYQTATFFSPDLEGESEYRYSRYSNPTRKALEENLAAIEGGKEAFATVSGNAAIHLVLSLLKAGDHIICGKEVHGGTFLLIKEYMGKLGVEASFVDFGDLESVKNKIKSNTRMIWVETPTNPLLKIVDIARVVEIAKYAEAICVVDNTLMSPFWQRPLDLGADIVVYSSTKYLNGHCDVISGAVIVKKEELAKKLQYWVSLLGIGEAPMDAWLVLRGLKTLPQRLKVHEYNTARIVEFLKTHPLVKAIYYPGLPDSPGYEIARVQQKSFGGMISFEVDLEALDLNQFIKSLNFFQFSHSSGGIISNISHPWSTSHKCINESIRKENGITEGLLRLSPGLEYYEDLIKDLQDAFKVAAKDIVLV
ncbi:MAG: cystathionine gamma-synthase [Verrucomicrobia bacterium]|nr:MAG: cystathionine gamma-synthase [Verrucomicrobiota bacterium]